MSGQQLFGELEVKTALLDNALNQLRKRGEAASEAERVYRIALSKELLLEREKGTPATILKDVVRGKEEIARLAFERDVAEVVYKSAQEAINTYKINIRILDEQLKREWGRA
ncbi:MAG: hypothetical protein ACOX3W_00565 [Christensenellaceae bacterium]|jgi:hypothetical protein